MAPNSQCWQQSYGATSDATSQEALDNVLVTLLVDLTPRCLVLLRYNGIIVGGANGRFSQRSPLLNRGQGHLGGGRHRGCKFGRFCWRGMLLARNARGHTRSECGCGANYLCIWGSGKRCCVGWETQTGGIG